MKCTVCNSPLSFHPTRGENNTAKCCTLTYRYSGGMRQRVWKDHLELGYTEDQHFISLNVAGLAIVHDLREVHGQRLNKSRRRG